MQQEFIPYAEALAMKELGYNEKCLRFHHVDGKLNEVSFPEDIGAPLYQQAFKWFREKHKLKISFMFWNGFNGALPERMQNRYELYIIPENGGSIIVRENDKIYFDEYEEAQLICLQQLIKIIQLL